MSHFANNFASEFSEFSCTQYDLSVLRYGYNVLEATIYKHMFKFPEDNCSNIMEPMAALSRLLYRLINRQFGARAFNLQLNAAQNSASRPVGGSNNYRAIRNSRSVSNNLRAIRGSNSTHDTSYLNDSNPNSNDTFYDGFMGPMNALNSTNNSADINIPFHTSTVPSLIASHLDRSMNGSLVSRNESEINRNNIAFVEDSNEYNRNIRDFIRNGGIEGYSITHDTSYLNDSNPNSNDTFYDGFMGPMNALNSTNNSADINTPIHISTVPSMIASHLDRSMNESLVSRNESEINQNNIAFFDDSNEQNRNIHEYNRNICDFIRNGGNTTNNNSDLNRTYNIPNQDLNLNIPIECNDRTIPTTGNMNRTMPTAGSINRTMVVADSVLNNQPIISQPIITRRSLTVLRPVRRPILKRPRWVN